MGEVVNLNRYRKAKKNAFEAQKAKENRVLHGRTKAEREEVQQQKNLEDKRHDGALIHLLPSGPSAEEDGATDDT